MCKSPHKRNNKIKRLNNKSNDMYELHMTLEKNIWISKLKWLKIDEIKDETKRKQSVKCTQIHHGWVLRHNGRMVPKE